MENASIVCLWSVQELERRLVEMSPQRLCRRFVYGNGVCTFECVGTGGLCQHHLLQEYASQGCDSPRRKRLRWTTKVDVHAVLDCLLHELFDSECV